MFAHLNVVATAVFVFFFALVSVLGFAAARWKAGDLAHIWNKFDPDRSPIEASDARFKGSDQAWLSFNLVKEPYGVGLTWPEVSSYPLSNRITGCVDYRTRIIFFHGSAKPWYPETFAASPWVQRHWNADKEPAGV